MYKFRSIRNHALLAFSSLLCGNTCLAQGVEIQLVDAGMICPGMHVTGEFRDAPQTRSGRVGSLLDSAQIDISTDVIVYARDAHFGPKVVLYGALVLQAVQVEVLRPDANGRQRLERFDSFLFPSRPQLFTYSFANDAPSLYGYWEFRFLVGGEELYAHSFHLVEAAQAQEILELCDPAAVS